MGNKSSSRRGTRGAVDRESKLEDEEALHPVGPVLSPHLATEGRDLFRRFAAHLDRQTEEAPSLGTPALSTSTSSRRDRSYGRSPDAAEFVRRFHWIEAVGAGSYSTVQRVQEKATGRLLAIKCIKKELITPDVQRQIETEARLQAKCGGHPNIVELVEFHTFGKEYFFVLEFCPSTVLKTIVLENQDLMYSEALAASVIRQTAAALKHIHKLGICHLDIKPDNLLLSSGCSPKASIGAHWFPDMKLADFGMAARCPVRRTVGTLFYVAPEILTDGIADQAADMWSLGVVVYVLLCGFPPFMPARRRGDPSIESKITACDYKFYSPFWDHVSPDAMDLIERLLVLDPSERLTADEVLRHRWLATASSDTMPGGVAKRLRRFSAKESWSRGIKAAQMVVRMRPSSRE